MSDTATVQTAPTTGRNIRAIYLAMMALLALSGLDQSIVATALPRIVAELGGMAHLSWVVTAYVLTSTATMPLYGKLADQFGRRPMIFIAMGAFLLGSILCGLAQDMTQLILFRALQGIGAGGFMPLVQIVIADVIPPAERGKRMGLVPVVFAVTSVLGPVLGGFLTDALSWHWIFYVNLPVGLVAFFAIARALPNESRHTAHSIDYLGSVLMTGSITAALLVLALGGTEWAWDSMQVGVCLAVALVAGIWLLFHVRRVPEPVLPPDLFHHRVFNVGSLVLSLTFMGLMGSSVFFPLFFQLVMGVSPAKSGMMTVAMMGGMIISSPLGGRWLSRTGNYKKPQIIGLSAAMIAFAVLSWGVAHRAGYLLIEPAIFLLGAGLGLVMPNMTVAVQNALPLARRGVGTAMLAFFRSLGGLLGVTGSGAMLTHALHLHGLQATTVAPGTVLPAATVEVYRQAIAGVFGIGSGLVLLGLIALLMLPQIPLVGHPSAKS